MCATIVLQGAQSLPRIVHACLPTPVRCDAGGVEYDFLETPSKMLENWTYDPPMPPKEKPQHQIDFPPNNPALMAYHPNKLTVCRPIQQPYYGLLPLLSLPGALHTRSIATCLASALWFWPIQLGGIHPDQAVRTLPRRRSVG